MNLLEADSMNLSFGERKILQNIYLKCHQGEIVSIIGRNGCGKSSLMKMIFGTLRAENQSVRVNKQFLIRPYQIPGAISYLAQDGLFMDYLTPKKLGQIFDSPEILEIDLIRDHKDDQIGSMSSGGKKLVEIMTMLYMPTMFTLLDEPFSFLSPVMVDVVVKHIRHQKEKKGIILTDHQFETVWSVSDRKYILRSGAIYKIQQKTDLQDHGYLSSESDTGT